jgi:Domain of unknown function (DUF2014)/Helix-loop-helix DNA-binding domain
MEFAQLDYQHCDTGKTYSAGLEHEVSSPLAVNLARLPPRSSRMIPSLQERIVGFETNQSPESYSSQSNCSPLSPGSASSYLLGSSPNPFPINTGDMTHLWTTMPADGFAGNDPTDPFAYGNWADYMRGDGNEEAVSPTKVTRGPPEYLTSQPAFPSAAVANTVGPVLSTSVDPASLSAIDTGGIGFAFCGGREYVFPEESLVSPAMSWSPRFQDQPDWQNQQLPQSTCEAFPPVKAMSWQEEQRLRDIAFQNAQPTQQSPISAGHRESTSTSPEPAHRKKSSRKRKSSTEGDASESPQNPKGAKAHPVKKTAHNMIEKRYRNNLNDKIAALRDSVPSLRVMSRGSHGNGEEDDDDNEDLEGLTPAHKLNKATVLAKATEYIRHLEKRNKKLADENEGLKGRLNTFEILAAAGTSGMGGVMGSMAPPTAIRYPFPDAGSNQEGMQGSPQGIVPVPESMRRMHAGQYQQQYVQQQAGRQRFPAGGTQPQQQGDNGRAGGRTMSKFMVGSLAGLMFIEGLGEREQGGNTPAARGLFALPTYLLGGPGRLLSPGQAGAKSSFSFGELLVLFKFVLVLGAVVYVLSPSFFDSIPKEKKQKAPVHPTAAPSLASPVEVRRKAWLTAIQTVWIPRHSFFLGFAALVMKTLKLSLRNLIGSYWYALLTGTTEEQEIARIRAWGIALDAQLGGGDAEISKSRLLLTLMASGTLPDTPARLMLKALHIRVLMWEQANADYGYCHIFQAISAKLARHYWNQARGLRRLTVVNDAKSGRDASMAEALPIHLAQLLEMESDDVMLDSILQRAYNLAWNRPTSEGIERIDEGMDAVVEDFSIRTPLDALAAWWSSLILHKALVDYLETGASDEIREELARDIRDAVDVAPPASGAHLRALVAKAVLGSPADSAQNINSALRILPDCEIYRVQQSELFANAVASVTTTAGIRVALRCAVCLASLHGVPQALRHRSTAIKQFNELSINKPSSYIAAVGLLGFVAALKTMEIFSADEDLALHTKVGLEHVAGCLRVWIGGERGDKCGASKAVRARIVEECLKVSRRCIGMKEEDDEKESGYGSLDEEVPYL